MKDSLFQNAQQNPQIKLRRIWKKDIIQNFVFKSKSYTCDLTMDRVDFPIRQIEIATELPNIHVEYIDEVYVPDSEEEMRNEQGHHSFSKEEVETINLDKDQLMKREARTQGPQNYLSVQDLMGLQPLEKPKQEFEEDYLKSPLSPVQSYINLKNEEEIKLENESMNQRTFNLSEEHVQDFQISINSKKSKSDEREAFPQGLQVKKEDSKLV